MSNDNVNRFMEYRDKVLAETAKGRVVILSDGMEACAVDLKAFCDQPVDGLLYDLNLLPEVILNNIEDPRWINRYATMLVIKQLVDQINQLKQKQTI